MKRQERAMAAASPTDPELWRAEAGATVRLAWPLVLTNLTQAGIQATDVVLLGWAGPQLLAAGALGTNFYMFALIFGMGLATAAAPLIARELGARASSVRDVRRTVRQSLWAVTAFALPVWAVMWNAEAILLALGQDPMLAADAGLFVRALQWGLLPGLWYLVLRSFVAALERPGWALIVSGGGVVVNAVVNYGLIFGRFGLPELGLLGAGIGSALTYALMFLAMAAIVTRQRTFRRYRLFGNFWRPDWPRFRDVWRVGGPIGIIFALEIGVFSGAVLLMGLIGRDAIAAHAIAIQVAALTFMVPMGLSQAATVRVGLAHGRKDKAAIARAGWSAFALGVGFMAAMALVIFAMPERLVHLFLDETDPANARVIPLAISFLTVAALFQIVDGAQSVAAGMLRGLQDTRVPMLYAAFGYWVVAFGIGIFLAFGLDWGGVGIWFGLAGGLAVVAVLMLARWMRRERLGLTG